MTTKLGFPKECKRLAEVDFPLVSVSKYSAIEKDKKTGNVSAIHVWWARRPLAACRAMNLACLLPDPADENCPIKTRKIIAGALDKLERQSYEGQSSLVETRRGWEFECIKKFTPSH
jgi:adenine-specific DNA methylase